MNKKPELEKIPLWKLVTKIANYADDLLVELPEVEKWGMESKIRGRSLDLTSDIAEAYGSIDPRDQKWLFGAARRDLFGLKNSLKAAHRRKYVNIDPDIMVAIDQAVDQVDKEIQRSIEEVPKWFEDMSAPAEKGKK
jgi:hypothetical protein